MILLLTSIFIGMVLVHIFYERYVVSIFNLKSSAQIRLIRVSFFYVSSVLLSLFFLKFNVVEIAYVFLVLSLVTYSYFHFFNMSLTARRVRMMIDAYEKLETHNLKSQEIAYTHKNMISNRIDRLIKLGQIKVEKDRIFIASKTFLFIGDCLSVFGKLLVGKNRIV